VLSKKLHYCVFWHHSATPTCDNAWRRRFPSIIEAVVLISGSKGSEQRMSYYARKRLSDMKLSEHPHTKPSQAYCFLMIHGAKGRVAETAVNWVALLSILRLFNDAVINSAA